MIMNIISQCVVIFIGAMILIFGPNALFKFMLRKKFIRHIHELHDTKGCMFCYMQPSESAKFMDELK